MISEYFVDNASNASLMFLFLRMAMAAVLLEEWLQELAAIAQEQSLLEQQAAILR